MPNYEVLAAPSRKVDRTPASNNSILTMSKIILAIAFALALSPAIARAQDTSSTGQTYFGFQVEREARLKTGQPPSYPAHLREANVSGEVLVQYVVDERGSAEMASFKVLKSSDNEFTESVRRAVSAMAFYPAEIQGKKVKQLVQQPFKFAAAR
jgi:TonB family protein